MSQFLIAYNNTQGFDSNQIHQIITNIPSITDWWHYLPNLYIVTTSSNAKQLADKIIPVFSGLLFVVIRLDMKDYNGVLHQDAWEWIRKKNNQELSFKTTAPMQTLPPITNLFSSSTTKPMTLEEILGIKR